MINMKFFRRKYLLTRIGARVSRKLIDRLNSAVNHLEVGRWMRARGFDTSVRVDTREQLFDLAARGIADKLVLYLEFGVYRGDSIRWWSKALKNPQSHLHGFDSFEGLPESWNLRNPKRQFATGGRDPEIADPRVRFFKGWFQDTLPAWVSPPHETLVINIDCDLYSSTIFALNSLRSLIQPGTYLYFDEFFDRSHEMKAFEEFLSESQLRFQLVAGDTGLVRTLFRCAV